MIKRFLLTWLTLAVAIGLTAWLLPGVDIKGGFGSLLLISAAFGLINAILGTIMKLLTMPITIMTLGLFALVRSAPRAPSSPRCGRCTGRCSRA